VPILLRLSGKAQPYTRIDYEGVLLEFSEIVKNATIFF
jgi:hypothetical protein